jgi:hypothetical protein
MYLTVNSTLHVNTVILANTDVFISITTNYTLKFAICVGLSILELPSALLRPPLWSSGQSSWLQIRRPKFDSRHYQKKKVVGLERGPLSLVSTTEELLDRKVAAPVLKTENTAVGIRHADHVAPSIRRSWQSLRRQAAVARSVWFARGLRPWSLVFLLH